MPSEIVLVLVVVLSSIAHFAFTQRARTRQARTQCEILERGVEAIGKVVAISRPLMSNGTAEIYFSFDTPHGPQLTSCQTNMRALRELGSWIPTVGAPVAIRYLPYDPNRATIPQVTQCASSGATTR